MIAEKNNKNILHRFCVNYKQEIVKKNGILVLNSKIHKGTKKINDGKVFRQWICQTAYYSNSYNKIKIYPVI